MLIPEETIITLTDSIKEIIREKAIDIEKTFPAFELSEEELLQAANETEEKISIKETIMYARINKIEKELQKNILINNEKNYLTFILGYDLLNLNLLPLPCDLSFEICQNLINLFLNSKEYENWHISAYEALKLWIEENISLINKTIDKKKNIFCPNDFSITPNSIQLLNNLCKRLQDDYNGNKTFEQQEEDRIIIYNIIDFLNNLKGGEN